MSELWKYCWCWLHGRNLVNLACLAATLFDCSCGKAVNSKRGCHAFSGRPRHARHGCLLSTSIFYSYTHVSLTQLRLKLLIFE